MAAEKVVNQTVSRAWLAWPILLAAVLLLTLFGPGLSGTAQAARDRFVLDYHDSQVRSHRGEPATLYLKRALKEQYPGVVIDDLELRRVVLIAKSRQGRGEARLQVGHRTTEMFRVEGGEGRFRDERRFTFDRVFFSNPSRNSNGPWQIDLQGNFIVRKVVLEVEVRRQGPRILPGSSRF